MLFSYSLNPNKQYKLNTSHNLALSIKRISRSFIKKNKYSNIKEKVDNKIKLYIVYNNNLFKVCSMLPDEEFQNINITLFNDNCKVEDLVLFVKGGPIDLLGCYEYEEKEIDSLNFEKKYNVLIETDIKNDVIVLFNNNSTESKEISSNNNKDYDSDSILFDDTNNEEISLKQLLKSKRDNNKLNNENDKNNSNKKK